MCSRVSTRVRPHNRQGPVSGSRGSTGPRCRPTSGGAAPNASAGTASVPPAAAGWPGLTRNVQPGSSLFFMPGRGYGLHEKTHSRKRICRTRKTSGPIPPLNKANTSSQRQLQTFRTRLPGTYTVAGHGLPAVTCPRWERDESTWEQLGRRLPPTRRRGASSQLGNQEVGWEVPGAS
jgi:hypothetical protein